MDEAWPDAEQRAERRVKLHTALDVFLDAYVDDEGKGGYAKATDEHVLALDDIVREIIDLKFQRDEDGDQAVLPRFENRRYGRTVFAYVPHPPKDRDALTQARYQHDLARAVSMLTASATEAMRMLDMESGQRVADLERDVVIERKIAEMREKIAADDLQGAEALVKELTEGNVIEAQSRRIPVRHPLIRNPADPRIEAIRYEFGMASTAESMTAALMTNDMLDRFERADASDRTTEHAAQSILSASYKRFGRKMFSEQIDRFNEIANRHRAARKATITPS